MAGYLSWVRDTVYSAVMFVINAPSNLYSTVSNSVSQGMAVAQSTIKQISDLGTTVANSSAIRSEGYQGFKQGVQGALSPLDYNVPIAIAESKDTRRAYGHSLSANLLFYMLPVIIYQLGMQQLRRMSPSYEDSYAETAVEMLATMYFIRSFISVAVDNVVNNANIYTAATNDYPADTTVVKPCKTEKCGTTASIEAGLKSSFYYIGSLSTVNFISSNIPVLGKFVAMPFRALVYGQALSEYKLGSVGMCTEHRVKELSKNNYYNLGLGLSMLAVVSAGTAFISRYTGAESFFIEDALFQVVFQYYMLASLVSNKPLPGEKAGLDAFSHSRMVVDKGIEQIGNAVVPMLKGPKDGDIMEDLEKIANFPPVKLARTVFLKTDLQDKAKFAERQSVIIFIDLHGKGIQENLQYVLDLRGDPRLRAANKLVKQANKRAPWIAKKFVGDENSQLLEILYNKELKKFLLDANEQISKLITRNARRQLQSGKQVGFRDTHFQALMQRGAGQSYHGRNLFLDSDEESDTKQNQVGSGGAPSQAAVVVSTDGKPKSSRVLIFASEPLSSRQLRQRETKSHDNLFMSPDSSPDIGRRGAYELRQRK